MPKGKTAQPERKSKARKRGPQSVKKVAECHFFEFYGFCLSHSLPGGKIRKVRKPLGFHPF